MAGGEAGKSDLGVRTISAIAMIVVAGGALWFGGWVWTAFVAAVSLGVLYEWSRLFLGFTRSFVPRLIWALGGAVYVGIAAMTLLALRQSPEGVFAVAGLVALIVAIDVGAYFAGRTIGGPKIAPRISPSKTWAGLLGAIAGASLVLFGIVRQLGEGAPLASILATGALCAVVAQAGDFFESWMKRRAGVKDSSNLIPGHGGLFDRVDGLLALLFLLGLAQFVASATAS
jgi:phosphatidate cytidylyltransferase